MKAGFTRNTQALYRPRAKPGTTSVLGVRRPPRLARPTRLGLSKRWREAASADIQQSLETASGGLSEEMRIIIRRHKNRAKPNNRYIESSVNPSNFKF